MGNVQIWGTKPIIKNGNVAVDQNCCCVIVDTVFIAINICNFNKWSDEIHDVWVNDPTTSVNANKLTRPTVDSNGQCGGGYYTNATPAPDYCTLGFQCCGTQVGGTCGAINYPAGAYPATGAANEDPCAFQKASNPMVCGTSGRDCGGDLIRASIPQGLIVPGLNTVYVKKTGPDRDFGSFGIVEVCKLKLQAGVWVRDGAIVSNTYDSNLVTVSITL